MGKQTKLQGVLTLNALSSEEHKKQSKGRNYCISVEFTDMERDRFMLTTLQNF